MIVPFIFNMETVNEYDHIAPFYMYFEMTKKHGWPVIAHERYCQPLKTMARLGLGDMWFEAMRKKFRFGKPAQDELDLAPFYMISAEFEQSLIGRFPSQLDAWIYLLKNRDESFEEYIEQLLDRIAADFEEPIEAFQCFCSTESLKYIARKRGIPIIHNEFGPFRPPTYDFHTGYFDLKDMYGTGELEDRYKTFLVEAEKKPVPILSRKELISLMADKKMLPQLMDIMDMKPVYELGVALPTMNYGLTIKDTLMSAAELKMNALRRYDYDQVVFRGHPNQAYGGGVMNNDVSPSSFHFICKCKRVAAVKSNVLFETLLLGKLACAYGEAPYYFMSNKGMADPSETIASLEFINFVVFGYLVPWEWVTDENYIRYRLGNPSPTDIYMKHFEHYMQTRAETADCAVI